MSCRATPAHGPQQTLLAASVSAAPTTPLHFQLLLIGNKKASTQLPPHICFSLSPVFFLVLLPGLFPLGACPCSATPSSPHPTTRPSTRPLLLNQLHPHSSPTISYQLVRATRGEVTLISRQQSFLTSATQKSKGMILISPSLPTFFGPFQGAPIRLRGRTVAQSHPNISACHFYCLSANSLAFVVPISYPSIGVRFTSLQFPLPPLETFLKNWHHAFNLQIL